MLFGADKKSNGDQCYSTYAEVSYPFSVGSVDMGACVGFTPWETSGTYGTDEFAVCNVALSATKAIRFSDRVPAAGFHPADLEPGDGRRALRGRPVYHALRRAATLPGNPLPSRGGLACSQPARKPEKRPAENHRRTGHKTWTRNRAYNTSST